MDKKGYEKASEPKHVKIIKEGDAISGKFVAIEQSTKFDDGYALKYENEKDGLCVSFINKQGYDLFIHNAVSTGDLFILEFVKMQENEKKTLKYRVFELYIKRA